MLDRNLRPERLPDRGESDVGDVAFVGNGSHVRDRTRFGSRPDPRTDSRPGSRDTSRDGSRNVSRDDFRADQRTPGAAEDRRVLLIEDNLRLAELIRDYMAEHHIAISIETDGNRAMARYLTEKPDVVILDIMLPGKDGFQVCREIRAHGRTPILMFTARKEDIDHVLGLELGADDFVSKPLDPRVLLARIEALYRRNQWSQPTGEGEASFEVGPFYFDRATRTASYKGQRLHLTASEFDLFYLLGSARGKVVTRDQIQFLSHERKYDIFSRTVDSRVWRIRTKLIEAGAPASVIQSVRTVGYLFAAGETTA